MDMMSTKRTTEIGESNRRCRRVVMVRIIIEAGRVGSEIKKDRKDERAKSQERVHSAEPREGN